MSLAPPPRPVNPRPAVPAPHARGLKAPVLATTIDPIRVLRRHVGALIGSAVLGGVVGLIAFVALWQLYPLYRGQVLFEVQPGLQTAGQVGTFDYTNDEMVYRLAQTETYMLSSRDVLDKAMGDLDVQHKTQWGKSFIQSTSAPGGGESFNNMRAVDELVEDIGAGVVRNSNLFNLSWSTHVKEDVPIVLNAIARAYLQTRSDRDTEVYNRNLTAFQNQADATERALSDLGLAMKSLIGRAGLTSLKDVYLSDQAFRMQELTRQLGDVAAALSLSQSSKQLVSDQLRGTVEPNSADVVEAENDHSMLNQIENIQFLKAQLRLLYETHDPATKLVQQMEDRVRASEEQRDAKLQEILRRNLQARLRQYSDNVERYGAAVEKIEKELEQIRNTLKDMAAEQSTYEAMAVRREHLETKHTAELQLVNEVNLMKARAEAARVRMVQRALEPRELSFPKPEIIIPLGVLVLVGLTLGTVFLRELLDQRVKSASDLAVLPGASVIGSIPDLEDDPTPTQKGVTPSAELVVRKHPLSVVAESYRQAATALQPLLERGGHQTLLVVGGLPGSGTTTVVSNLAAAAAGSGRKVLVVDANFRRPRLAEAMGVSGDGPGLGDLLSGTASLDQAVLDAEGIGVISAGTPANRVFDRLNNGRFDSILAELRGRYDLIVFDAPPAVVSGDAMVLANKVDAAVLVVRAHQEHRGLVARMMQRLSEARCEMLGVLLNRPRGVAGGYLRKNYATMAEYSAKGNA